MKKTRNENGVITMITLITVLFIVSFLMTSYALIANKVKNQKDMISEIRSIYEPKVTMEETFSSYFSNDNVIPIYTVEQLLAIGNGEKYNIDGKIYTFLNDTEITYVLKNNLTFIAEEVGLEEDWIKIDQDNNFEGNFEWNGYTINVTTLGNKEIAYNKNYKPSTFTTIEDLPETVKSLEYNELEGKLVVAADTGKISSALQETITLNGVTAPVIAVIPTGFELTEEKTISDGLVIQKEENEFVWIPVANYKTYAEGNDIGTMTVDYVVDGITIGDYDSYQTIQYLYGDALGEITDQTSYNTTFSFLTDKIKIEKNIQTYGGFYLGRYETTYDSLSNDIPQGIGVKKGKNVLQASSILKAGKNEGEGKNGEEYYYRWWGLYKAQKDMYANDETIGSLMITVKQWDQVMTYTGYGDTIRRKNTYKNRPELSGSAYLDTTDTYDLSKNIYDLAGNLMEWTINGMDKRNENISRRKIYV